MTPFLTGFNESKDSYKFWGRPAYIAQMPDGALLVSDEQVGAIYRISYQKPRAAKTRRSNASAAPMAVGRHGCSPRISGCRGAPRRKPAWPATARAAIR